MSKKNSFKQEKIPFAYDNDLLRNHYLATKEKMSFFQKDIAGYGNNQNRLLCIEKELKHLTLSHNFVIFYMGGILIEAKKLLPHGEFGPWLKRNIPFSKRTAQKYMRVYTVCLGHPALLFSLSRSVLEEVCEAGVPASLQEKLPQILNYYGAINKSDFEQLKKEYAEDKFDIDSNRWQLVLLERQQADYELINIKIIDHLMTVLKNEATKISTIVAPNDLNKLLPPKKRMLEIIPVLKQKIYNFTQELLVLKEDLQLELSIEKNEYLAKDIIELRDILVVDSKDQSKNIRCAQKLEIDDGSLAKEYYDRIALEELSPEDFICSDDTEPNDRFCAKVLDQLGPDDVWSVDDGASAIENAERVAKNLVNESEEILGQLGPGDALYEDEERLAELQRMIILGRLAGEDFFEQSQ